MKHQYQSTYDTGVVARLRITFVVIIIAISITGLISGFLLYELRVTQKNSIEKSLSTLAQSQNLQSRLVSINGLTERLGSELNTFKLHRIHAALLTHKNHLQNVLENNLHQSDLINIDTENLNTTIKNIELSANAIIKSKLTMIDLDKAIVDTLSRARIIRTEFSSLIEPLSLELATTLNESLNSLDQKGGKPTADRSKLANSFNDQYQLLETSYRFSSLLDQVESLNTVSNQQDHNDQLVSLNLQFNSLTQILVNFSDKVTRRKMAAMVKELRTLTLGNQGLMDNIATFQINTAQFNKNHETQINHVQALSSTIDTVVANTKKGVTKTIADFNTALNKIIFTLGFFGLVVLATTAFVNHYVVERQINRRMQRLTKAVLAIANGNHDSEVDVDGRDEIGSMAGALGIFKDNAIELKRSNTELEKFAYAASHDLRSPLRAIESLALWTLEDSGDDLTTEAKNNLEQLLIRAKRLSQLQTDLLEYSKAGKPDESVQDINFNQLIDDLADMLDPDHKFAITVSDAPVGLSTQAVPLKQILLNLMTNAIKHHDLDTGQIDIGIVVVNNRLRISVRDDGPGIAVEYHERIFGLFEKLESRDKVEGSGLGLSLVTKMVERFKGSITVLSDSSKDRGSTFVFDWPYTTSQVETVHKEPIKRAQGF